MGHRVHRICLGVLGWQCDRIFRLAIPMSALEDELWFQLRAAGLDKRCVRQWKWAVPERRFVADFGFPNHALAVEVEGGLYMKRSEHNSVRGITRDIEKANLAVKRGIRQLRFTDKMIRSGEALRLIEYVLMLPV
jgi:very-short-patch-repair endonuclease